MQRLYWVQGLRFVAAFAVVLHHALSLFMPLPIDLGTWGVLLFFVLSGYVITRQIDANPIRFALHRLLRIYPPYLGTIILAAAVLIPLGVVPLSQASIDPSMTLLPIGGRLSEWSRVPYWTLLYEMVFYGAVFAFMFAGPRRFDYFLIAWAVVIVARNSVFFSPYQPMSADFLTIITSHLSICFIGGAALARLHAGNSLPAAAVLLVAFAPAAWVGNRSAAIGAACVGLLHLATLLDLKVNAPRFLTWAGDRSYGLYLIHNPVIALLLALPVIGMFPRWVVLSLLVIIPAGVGLLYGHAEFLFYKWAKSAVDRRLQDTGVPAAGGSPSRALP